MKLTDVELDAFGIWSRLMLRDLSPQCTVFYGPNEAGKTTLLQFIRAVLYGFASPNRARYLPPLNAAMASGTLMIATADEGPLQIHRRQSGEQPAEIVSIESADGAASGEAHLSRLLHDVDEMTFENVFAIGLRELQELGTLDDLDAARWLYNLTTGLDRISLSEVIGELENSRSRLMADDGSTSVINRLQQQCDTIRQEVGELTPLSQYYGELLVEQSVSSRQISNVERELSQREAEIRTLESAVLIYDSWQRRNMLDEQIAAIGSQQNWPSDAIARIERFTSTIRQGKRKTRRLNGKCQKLREEIAQIKLNDAVCSQSARIASLAENEAWIVSLEQEIHEAELAVKRLQDERQAIEKTLPATSPAGTFTAAWFAPLAESQLTKLQRRAAHLRKAFQRAKSARQKIAQERSTVEQQQRQVEAALAVRKQVDLTAALQNAGERVTQLRNRLQLEERIQRLANSKTDLEQQIADLRQRQILPPWTLVGLGGVFVLGVVLILAGLLLPASFSGALGWPMAWLGLLGIGSAVAAKFSMERSLANQLVTSRKQWEMVESQARDARQERDQLDQTLPKGAGPLAARLQSAEQDLSDLEKLLPLEAQRQSAVQSAEQIASRDTDARQRFEQALRRWRGALQTAGLPENWKPAQVRDFAKRGRQWASVQQQLSERQADLDRRRRELAVMAGRIDQAFVAANLQPAATLASDRLRQLRRELAQQENWQQQLAEMRHRLQKLRRRRASIRRRMVRCLTRRRRLLRQCGVATVSEFRGRAAEFSKIAALRTDRESTAREIASVLVGVSTEEIVASMFASKGLPQLESELAAAKQDGEEIRRKYRTLIEQSGRRQQQIEELKTDRRLALKRFELGQAQHQLDATLRRWQVLTIVWRLLVQLKDDYERHRQPETLREASEYLSKFTRGKYVRVWTRLGENALWVDDNEQHTLPLDVLSHGTREQLLLSLRMSLVSFFARRGVELPLVLDDVLVNFDTQRAAAAVETLRDFTQAGHQILMFTCHEHIAHLCQTCKLDVRRLPDDKHSGVDQPFEAEAVPVPRRSRSRRLRDEVAPVDIKVAAPANVPMIVKSPAPAISMRSATALRMDMPQRVGRPPSIMRRWAAEEFNGELDDRVNPLWLLREMEPSELQAGAPVAAPIVQNLAMLSAGVPQVPVDELSASFEQANPPPSLASNASVLRLFAEESTAIIVEPLSEEEEWHRPIPVDGS